MKTTPYATLAVSALLLGACVTAPPKPAHTAFEDIPVPKGLTYQVDDSTMIESPRLKAARMLYRGRVEPESLAQAMRTTLEANGWRNVTASSGPSAGTVQVYEKDGSSLQVQIWEGGLFGMYTYLEMTTGRIVAPGTSALPAASLTPPPVPSPPGVQPVPAAPFTKTN